MADETDRRPVEAPARFQSWTVPTPPRTWVQLLLADSQLSFEEPTDFAGWLRSGPKPALPPRALSVAAYALFVTSLPALILASVELARQPTTVHLPWFICSLLAGLWPFHETPGHLRTTCSAFVTVAAFAVGGFCLGVWCATITAVSSWAAAGVVRQRSRAVLFLLNWAILVLSAAAGAVVFEFILGTLGHRDLLGKLASNRFLLAFPAGALTYVLVNTSLAALGDAIRHRDRLVPTWENNFSGVGLFFTFGIILALSFVMAFGSWGAVGPENAGSMVAFLMILLLLGAGKQSVLQHEAREHIRSLSGLLIAVTRPDDRKHPFATYLLDSLLTQGTRRFLSGLPREELTFEAEEAVFDAEIAWKLGASEASVRSFLTQHETPDASGPFGLRQLGLPVWSPAFPEKVRRPAESEVERGDWSGSILRSLLDAATPPSESLTDENRKWNRLAVSAARTVHSLLERYDFGRRLNAPEDLQWWTACKLVGFEPIPAPGTIRPSDGPETQQA